MEITEVIKTDYLILASVVFSICVYVAPVYIFNFKEK
jgi:hypothetical protein